MPVITNINLSLKLNQVLRRQGIANKPGPPPQVKSLIRELLSAVRNDHLLKPSIAYDIYSIIDIGEGGVHLEGNFALHGSIFLRVLPQAKQLGVAVGTIGAELEMRVTEDFNRKQSLRGTLLDGIGSAAVDRLSEEVCRLMRDEASSRGYQSSSPVNPGMPGFPVSEQGQLLALVPAEEIGVRLTSSGMMVPRKSISVVIGLGLQMPTWTQAEVCARCHLSKTCPYRAGTN